MQNVKWIIFTFLVILLSIHSPAFAFNAGGIDTNPPFSRDLLNIPLQWNPSETPMPLDIADTLIFQNKSITVKLFNDLRKNPQEIGRNVEKKFTRDDRYVTTKDNVAEWLTKNFIKVLRDSFDISTVSANADVSLEADILRFYVLESQRYNAEIALKVRLLSSSGSVLWEGVTSGKSDNWGASYKASNYYEGLSNACIEAVHNLFKNESFKMAFEPNKK